MRAVGAKLAVTPRTVQLLLEGTGATFSDRVMEHRMRQAWRLLSSPRPGLKIASIAHDCGFNDITTFNRAFRRRFGESPTAARGAGGEPPSRDGVSGRSLRGLDGGPVKQAQAA